MTSDDNNDVLFENYNNDDENDTFENYNNDDENPTHDDVLKRDDETRRQKTSVVFFAFLVCRVLKLLAATIHSVTTFHSQKMFSGPYAPVVLLRSR